MPTSTTTWRKVARGSTAGTHTEAAQGPKQSSDSGRPLITARLNIYFLTEVFVISLRTTRTYTALVSMQMGVGGIAEAYKATMWVSF